MSLTGKPELTTAAPVINDGFWPDLWLSHLMSRYRIPAEYADDTILTGLHLSMIRVNDKLSRAHEAMTDLGYTLFDEFLTHNSNIINDVEKLKFHYQHAVYSRAKAFLLKQFNTINRRKIAENEAKESDDTEQYWLDESTQAMAAIMRVFFVSEQFAGNANIHVASL